MESNLKEAYSSYYNKLTKEKLDECLLEMRNNARKGSKQKYDITKDGYVGNGIYCLGGVEYTGKRGWDQFNKALLDEIKGPKFKIELRDDYYDDKIFYMENIDSKYYTPTIDEFHVGFEFEQTYAYREMDGSDDIYKKHTFTIDPEDRYSQWQDIIGALKYGLIRVKRLDRDDIEGFGFAIDESHKSMMCDEKPNQIDYMFNSIKNGIRYRLIYVNWWVGADNDNKTEYRLVKIQRKNIDNDEYSTIFSGYIKNKSELGKVLKMIRNEDK